VTPARIISRWFNAPYRLVGHPIDLIHTPPPRATSSLPFPGRTDVRPCATCLPRLWPTCIRKELHGPRPRDERSITSQLLYKYISPAQLSFLLPAFRSGSVGFGGKLELIRAFGQRWEQLGDYDGEGWVSSTSCGTTPSRAPARTPALAASASSSGAPPPSRSTVSARWEKNHACATVSVSSPRCCLPN
jgi:hypothetical protein